MRDTKQVNLSGTTISYTSADIHYIHFVLDWLKCGSTVEFLASLTAMVHVDHCSHMRPETKKNTLLERCPCSLYGVAWTFSFKLCLVSHEWKNQGESITDGISFLVFLTFMLLLSTCSAPSVHLNSSRQKRFMSLSKLNTSNAARFPELVGYCAALVFFHDSPMMPWLNPKEFSSDCQLGQIGHGMVTQFLFYPYSQKLLPRKAAWNVTWKGKYLSCVLNIKRLL